MPQSYIQTSDEGAVRSITLDRPDVLNALNIEMADALLIELRAASASGNIRSILITGSGKGFCAGQDLQELSAAEAAGKPHRLGPIVERYNSIVQTIVEMPKPVVCAVNGVAAGAGANLALACDLVIASDKATFVQAFVKVGLVPDSGGTFFLPRLVGLAKARELAMLGEKISAADAHRFGLIYQVVPASSLTNDSEELAARLAAMPTHALGLIKKAFHLSLTNSLHEQLALEKDLQIECAGTLDYQEGKKAFLEKRPAKFTGK